MPTGQGTIFLQSGPSPYSLEPQATWVTTAGWAAAAARLGPVTILTPWGRFSPDEAVEVATRPAARPGPSLAAAAARTWRRRLPEWPATAVKDGRAWTRAQRFRRAVPVAGAWASFRPRFVWQRHGLFQRAGHDLAGLLQVPLVLKLDALSVWESARWGVRRPGWGPLLVRWDETKAVASADVVACVSQDVADSVCERGVPSRRVVVTPSGVDVERFGPSDGGAVRRELGLENRFVVGWAGSFRSFHGIEVLVAAADRLRSQVPDLALLLVGDGAGRAHLQAKTEARGWPPTVFTGAVAHGELPGYLAAMDACALPAPHSRDFHYSPAKLAEYLAAGRPVVASALGQVRQSLEDGVTALLVPPADPQAMADALARLHADPGLRARLGWAARAAAERDWSWDQRLATVIDRLAELGRRPEPA